jgi:hypothetical protein
VTQYASRQIHTMLQARRMASISHGAISGAPLSKRRPRHELHDESHQGSLHSTDFLHAHALAQTDERVPRLVLRSMRVHRAALSGPSSTRYLTAPHCLVETVRIIPNHTRRTTAATKSTRFTVRAPGPPVQLATLHLAIHVSIGLTRGDRALELS